MISIRNMRTIVIDHASDIMSCQMQLCQQDHHQIVRRVDIVRASPMSRGFRFHQLFVWWKVKDSIAKLDHDQLFAPSYLDFFAPCMCDSMGVKKALRSLVFRFLCTVYV